MNDFIRRAARRGERSGVMARLASAGPLGENRQAALNAAMADAELAIKHGDAVGREMAEARIDRLFDEARAAREPTQEAATEPPVRLDGGVRGRRGVAPPPRLAVESAGQLFARAMRQSVEERAASGGDPYALYR